MNDQELLTQCYHRMYQGMIQKDSSLLAETLDDSFVLLHMTGMRQTKRQYIEAIIFGCGYNPFLGSGIRGWRCRRLWWLCLRRHNNSNRAGVL